MAETQGGWRGWWCAGNGRPRPKDVFLLLEDEHGLINVVSRAGHERWRALPRGEPLLLMVGGSAAARAWGECEVARSGHRPLHLHDAAR